MNTSNKPTEINYRPIVLADPEREVLIHHYRNLITTVGESTDNKRKNFHRMAFFVLGRSKEQVKRMEIELGLDSE